MKISGSIDTSQHQMNARNDGLFKIYETMCNALVTCIECQQATVQTSDWISKSALPTTPMPTTFTQSGLMWFLTMSRIGGLLQSNPGPFCKAIGNPFCVRVVELWSAQRIARFAALIINPGIVP